MEKYEIERIGVLALGYKTFLDREAREDEIEICMWDNDFTHRWTIASFDYNEKEESYYLVGSEYLVDIKDWNAFGKLVKKGYEILRMI